MEIKFSCSLATIIVTSICICSVASVIAQVKKGHSNEDIR